MRIHKLIDELWPGIDPLDVNVSYKGGGRNFIIGIALYEPQNTLSRLIQYITGKCIEPRGKNRRVIDRYILRIPPFSAHSSAMAYQVTTLAYVKRYLRVKTPEIITHDPTCDNALGQRYMLQTRLPGTPLTQLWPALNLHQKKSYVHWVVEFMLDLHHRESSRAGLISPANTTANLRNPKIDQLPVPRPFASMTAADDVQTAPATPQSTRGFLLSLCERQRGWAGSAGLAVHDGIWDGFVAVIKRLYERGFLPDDEGFYFDHGDLHPCNILAEVASDTSIRVTGVLDWDLGVFAPKFVGTRPPFYLWSDGRAYDEREEMAVFEPEDSEKAELKREYERAVGDRFGAWAAPEVVLARKMYRCLTWGILEPVDRMEAEQVLRQFETLWSEKR
ncbi:hypothetical protein P171DRAFT_417435 [Karstenula rhodostoma CBS 690.94]|uniref:Aminoglycoside phosphotransferase domain-containing protein n=1 Tax=Karstenula rhodostoma CBS 690.94 TaxID=1392251 RepID=A0A9P4PFT5_9PLEO|nr:hypothetical protein P171DRAFT_417435 [Karstenula rhodostoma CBS 690.94]